MDKTIFKTGIARLMVLLLPTPLRRAGMVAALESLGVPFAKVLGSIEGQYYTIEHRAQYNGQVCRLEMMLNDLLDPQRGIRVVEGDLITADAYIVKERGVRNLQGFPKVRGAAAQILIPSRRASQHTKYDFTVVMPAHLTEGGTAAGTESMRRRLTTLVNTYKQPGTRWNIQMPNTY